VKERENGGESIRSKNAVLVLCEKEEEEVREVKRESEIKKYQERRIIPLK
jgi:hypothetical protein